MYKSIYQENISKFKIDIIKESDQDEKINYLKDMYFTYIEQNDIESSNRMKDILKNKYNVDIEEIKKVNLNDISLLDKVYNLSDFKSWQEYITYCKKLHTLRFNKYKKYYIKYSMELNKYQIRITDNNLLFSMLNNLHIKYEINITNHNDIANVHHGSNKINFSDDWIDLPVLIHEIGHVYEHFINFNPMDNILGDLRFSSTNYIKNPSETFAEHFMNYFLYPKTLKYALPMVYNEMNNLINSNWKIEINNFIKLNKKF